MATISKEINKNNFIRWRRTTGLSLNDLLAFGLPDEQEVDLGACGLSLRITLFAPVGELRSVRVEAVFENKVFPVEIRILNEDGNEETDWTEGNAINEKFPHGKYVAEIRNLGERTNCSSKKEFTITEQCGIGVEIANGKTFIAQHYYADGKDFPTLYEFEVTDGGSFPMFPELVQPGGEVRRVLTDAAYRLTVTKQGSETCKATTNFVVNNDQIRLLFQDVVSADLKSGVPSGPLYVKNLSPTRSRTLVVIVDPKIASYSLPLRREIVLAPLEEQILTWTFTISNPAGAKPTVLLYDKDRDSGVEGFNDKKILYYFKTVKNEQDTLGLTFNVTP